MRSISPSGVVLTSTKEDKKWGSTVSFITSIPIEPWEVYPPEVSENNYNFTKFTGRILHEYQITFIAKGKGEFYCKSLGKKNKIDLSEGSVFLLFPGEWHNYYPDESTGWLEYSIGFESPWLDKLVQEGFFSKQKPVFNVHSSGTLRHLIETALNVAIRQQPGHQQLLSGIIVHFLSHLLYLDKNRSLANSSFQDKMSAAKDIIESELQTITPTELAARLNMSYSSFRSTFKKYTGFPPAKYIAEIKILKAKDLLNCTNIPVKEVALAVGIENYEYFSTMFKLNTGYTPSAYRAEIMNKNN